MEKALFVSFFTIVTFGCGGTAIAPAVVQDAGFVSTVDDAGPTNDARCTPQLTVILKHSTGNVSVGMIGYCALTITFTATACRDIPILDSDFQIESPEYMKTDSTPICAAPCSASDWNFMNPSVKEDMPDQPENILMGISEASSTGAIHFFSSPPWTLAANTSRVACFTFDVADPPKTDIIGKQFQIVALDINSGFGAAHLDDLDPGDLFTVVASP